MNNTNSKILGVVLYGSPILLFLILEFGFGFNGLYGQDSHTYFQYAKGLNSYLNSGEHPGSFYWPKLYPYLGAIFGKIGLPILLAMRLISLLALWGVIFYTQKIIRLIFDQDGKLWLLIGMVTSVYFVRWGILVMSDMLAAFIVIFGYWNFVKYMKFSKMSSAVLLIASTVVAFFVRYPTLPLLFAPILVVAVSMVRKAKYGWFIAVLSLGLLVSIFVLNFSAIEDISNQFFQRWSFKNIFSRSFTDNDGHSSHWVPNIIYIFGNFFHIGYLAVGVLLIPFFKKPKDISLLLLISVFFYLFFLSGFSSQSYRFLVLSHPIVLVLLFPFFQELWEWLQRRKLHSFFIIGVILLNTAFFIYSFGKTYKVHKNEKVIANALKEINSGQIIYSFYVDQSFPSYGIENEVRSLYFETHESFERGSLLVFNVEKFQNQWKGTNVMINWNKVSSEYQLVELKSFENNWKIYRIQ